ncbi:uncharacterized protein LOC108629219 [Ceratina calcarata]|uniref:Uncharacterized protein LOC108629219 n=1 Tax=Ceratina calcarata TaxID=156304 RepID=A0AAJ7NBJ2_9HYME|nr:uncharacterized protein LOC108629219 [Ceratina calcarata]
MNKVDMNNLLLYTEENLVNHPHICYEEEEPVKLVKEKQQTNHREIINAPLISPQSILDDTAFKPSSESALRDRYKMLSPEDNVKNQNLPSLHLFRYNRNNTNPFLQDEQSVYDISPQEFMQLWNDNLVVLTQISGTLSLLFNKLNSAKDEDILNKVKSILSNAYSQIPICTDPMNTGVANICRDTISSISSYLSKTNFNETKTPLFSTCSNNNNNFSGYTVPVQNSKIQEATEYPNWTNNNYFIPGNDFVIPNHQNWEAEKFGQGKFSMDVQNYLTNNSIELFTRTEKPVDSNTYFKETNPFRLSLSDTLQITEKEDNSCKNREPIIYDVINIENRTNSPYVNGNINGNGISSKGNEYLKLQPTNNDERNNSVARYTMDQSRSLEDITRAMSNICISDQRLPDSSIPKNNNHCLPTSKDFISSYDLQSKKQGPIFVDTFNSRQSAPNQNGPMLVTTNSFVYPMSRKNKTINDGYRTSMSTSHPLCNSLAIVKSNNVPQYNQKLMVKKYNEMGSVFEEKNKVSKDSCQVLDSKKWTSDNWIPVQPISQNKANISDNNKQQNSIQAGQDSSNVHLDNMGIQTMYAKQCNLNSVADSSKHLSLNAKLYFQVVELQTDIVHIFHYLDEGWLLLDEFVDKFTQFTTSWYLLNELRGYNMSIKFEEIDRTKNSIELLTTNNTILKPTRDILNGVTKLYLMSLESVIQSLHTLRIISYDDVNAIFMYERFLSNSVAYEIWLVVNTYKQLKCAVEQL